MGGEINFKSQLKEVFSKLLLFCVVFIMIGILISPTTFILREYFYRFINMSLLMAIITFRKFVTMFYKL
jgi:hypothetical protein